ncbi:peptidase domain-containing ABC transporter [Bradyrhizobium cytisi]|uniref:Type I secretion system permease/ATPase n=1 Tax=Bradyrhizobium cytisi TaxID=515489 RepID=A0A5S4WYY4_9BRAD|nr:type I secretion system permease/ATPase [Bradyrhizobium cytisi]TYL85902.1 type I secretion system permease/ATPase [Bradyrhizobium cytisi]
MHDNVRVDTGLAALCGIAAYYRIAADPTSLAREMALKSNAEAGDVIRAARIAGLRARLVRKPSIRRVATVPLPAITRLQDGTFVVLGGRTPSGFIRVVDPITRISRELPIDEIHRAMDDFVLLIQRRVGGSGVDPRHFGFQWFLSSVWRYRRPLLHVVVASLFVQLFALVTPLFFQVVVDKVLPHKSYSTLLVLVGGIAAIGLFDVVLQYLRTYALAHTSNRIDVELSHRLFGHLLRLPISYFESRSAGQTIARVRELETIRSFLTGQGLFSLVDLLFAFVYIAVLEAYSVKLTWTVLAAIPAYLLIAIVVRPPLKEMINEKFNLGAASQQFIVESVVGIQTIKSSAVEPIIRTQWEERLAAYVRSAFAATKLGAGGQNAIQYVSKLSSALLLLFGAEAVINEELTIGGLVAFNMIAGQVAQPILRLSQFWQDFQQVQVSVERLGDILNASPEHAPAVFERMSSPKGQVEFKHVTFRYAPGEQDALKDVSFTINPGEVIGIVGPSGSGKSTLAKLTQRLYVPSEGEVLLDGRNLAHIDPVWLRRHIGVILQESTLFHRTIHENIALANPAMSRSQVIAVARLSGADEFVSKLRQGYDTILEERGVNLSGGQRQRLAIARALATDPPILVFDEATSALDYESEQIIQTNMRHIARGRTVIIIAHRLVTVRHCDRIIGVVDGRIVETGTHDALVRRPQGLYARLWALQNNTAKDQPVA